MLKRFSRWSLFLVALLSISLVLAACGDQTTPPTNDPAQNQGGVKAATGVKSAVASSFPDTTSFYLTLNTNTNSDQIKGWQSIVQYISAVPEVKNVFQNVDVLALAKIGTYDADIKPWIGDELAIGLTDVNAAVNLFSGGQAAPGEIPVLVAAQVKDAAKANAFVAGLGSKLKGMGLQDPTKTTEGDVTYYNFNLGFLSIVAGVGKDKLFIGGGPKIVKDAFTRTEATSLAGSAQYKTVTGKLPASNLAFVYFDYQAVVKTLQNNQQVKSALDSLNASNLDYTGSMGLTFGTAAEGFQVESYQTILPDKTPAAVSELLKKGANPNKILTALPETTLAFANMRDASKNYDQLVSTLKTMGGAAGTSVNFEQGLADFEKQTGLNLKNDVVNLFSGEFALFVTPSTVKEFPIGIGLAADATDKAATQAKLDKIAAAVEKTQGSEIKWASKTTGTTTYRTASLDSGKVKTTLNLGIAGNYAFFTVGDEVTAELITAATGGKNFTNGANAASFNKVKSTLPGDNQGYTYLDVQAAVKLATANLPAGQAQQVKGYTDRLTKLYSVGATSRQSTTEATNSIFIYFPVTK